MIGLIINIDKNTISYINEKYNVESNQEILYLLTANTLVSDLDKSILSYEIFWRAFYLDLILYILSHHVWRLSDCHEENPDLSFILVYVL